MILKKLVVIMTIVLLSTGCSQKETSVVNNSISQKETKDIAPSTNSEDNNESEKTDKINRDFAFTLYNIRQQFKDISKIGIDANKDYIQKKINKEEFSQKVDSMKQQYDSSLNTLKNTTVPPDEYLKNTHSELVAFLSNYYNELIYKELKANADNDTKTYQSLVDQSKDLESKNREIDKIMNDLKTQYKF